MYIPSRFRQKDEAAILDLVRRFPLATVISDGPMLSHLPLVLSAEADGRWVLLGHLARANPHFARLSRQPEVYCVFNGAQTYVTPRWYARDDVPTWNYAVVHMRGRLQLIEDFDGIVESVRELSAQVDPDWNFALPDDLADPAVLVHSIAAFKIEVESVDAKFKLSQNRSREDRQGVVQGLLRERDDDHSREIAELISQGLAD